MFQRMAPPIQIAEELSTIIAVGHQEMAIIGFQITTDSVIRTLGLPDVNSGDAEKQLDAFINFIIEKMGDVLPDVLEQWDDLDETAKVQLGNMNHFCNLHTLIGAATY